MLDTYGRKHITKYINQTAHFLHNKNITANTVTYIALVIGLASASALYFDKILLSLFLLWTSGLLDVIDGELARLSETNSQQGMLFDIFFDRIVESGILINVALMHINLRLNIIFLFFSILMSMTIFLISGSIIKNETNKSFYYQPGLMERTEGFIMLSLIIIFQNTITINIFTLLVLITVIQRFSETIKYLNAQKNSDEEAQ